MNTGETLLMNKFVNESSMCYKHYKFGRDFASYSLMCNIAPSNKNEQRYTRI